jgi:hypothetical protein
MFCPNCGFEEEGRIKFCRKCGIELNTLRLALERPDALSGARAAREQIAREVAAKIAELRGSDDLSMVVDHLLPQVEKFLETPEEKRLRHMHDGVITACTGIGIIILSLALLTVTHTAAFGLITGAAGALVLIVGLGIMLAGALFTVPRRTATRVSLPSRPDEATRELDTDPAGLPADLPPNRIASPSSTPEETTELLEERPAQNTTRANSA